MMQLSLNTASSGRYHALYPRQRSEKSNMQVLSMALFVVASAEATRHTYRRYGGGAIPLHVEDPPTPTVRTKKQRQPMPPPPVLFVNNEQEPNIIVFAEPVHLHVRNVLPYLPPQIPALPAPVVDQGSSLAPQARPPCGKCGEKRQVSRSLKIQSCR